MTQREPLLTTFSQLLANSQENTSRLRVSLDKCGFCSNQTNLNPCENCGCVAYCSSEHQKFDWKKHKPLCKTLQHKLSSIDDLNGERLPLYYSNIFPAPSTPAAIINVPTVFSKSSTSSPTTDGLNGTPTSTNIRPQDPVSEIPGTTRIECASSETTELQDEDVLIETDDPDIQIIEGPSTQSGTPSRLRKRPAALPKVLKDHSLNMAYSITPEEHRHYLMEQGRSFSQHQSAELRLAYISEHILSSLSEYGWSVVDNFLGAEHCWHIHKEMRTLESRGLFSAGQVADAKHKDEQHLKDIRSDKTYWFEGTDQKSSDACTIRMLVTYLDSIVHRFARRLKGNQIHGRSKPMLAIYPSNGSRYVKHVDNPSKDGRRITVIYYCNPKWDYKVDGGVLRLYPETSVTPLDIEPRADRLIAFWSDNRVPHEVMPVYKDRLAITVWYMDRQERDRHHGKVDPKETSIRDACSIGLSPKVKNSKIDPAQKKMQRVTLDDAADQDEADSGRGTSILNTSSSIRAPSTLSRSLSHDSSHLSDDDEDRLPRRTDLEPEFNI